NPFAVSDSGARGLMQIMPENFGFLGINDPFDPRENILGGAFYLKQLLEDFNGDLPKALAAYNAGPTAVKRYNSIPPYSETEKFVTRVLAAYNALRDRQ
ncbi:MAG: lytic transglycosylase domain-containing protein, partial [Deltaproteobacteria bacterium]|nr:lytic transglycosylase domain-containing protein [Deltaproteobacteria bacterium]